VEDGKKRLVRVLQAEARKSIEMMARNNEVSHSFNVLGDRTYTFLILWTPSTMDADIYAALKPVIESRLGEGVLVEPNPRALDGGTTQ
jgi:hypothetical protein